PLHLYWCDRRVRTRAVAEDHRVPRVLPVLVVEPVRRAPPVLDESVPVAVAGPVDPGECASRSALELADDRVVAAPAPQLRQQDEEERCRIDGALVAVGPDERRLAAPDLVDDLSRLGVPLRIVDVGLCLGEGAQRG